MDLTVDFEIYFSQLLDFISVWILFSSDIGAACFRVYRMVMRMSRWGCNEEKNSARGKGQIQIQTQRLYKYRSKIQNKNEDEEVGGRTRKILVPGAEIIKITNIDEKTHKLTIQHLRMEEDQIVGRLVKIMVPASTVVCATR